MAVVPRRSARSAIARSYGIAPDLMTAGHARRRARFPTLSLARRHDETVADGPQQAPRASVAHPTESQPAESLNAFWNGWVTGVLAELR